MTALGHQLQRRVIEPAHAFDITGAKARLCAGDGGYEIVHESARLQIFVYALVAPEPDHRLLNAEDELYIVLEGSGMLDVDGDQLELREGRLAFVPAGADHCFTAYEHLTVLAIREREAVEPPSGDQRPAPTLGRLRQALAVEARRARPRPTLSPAAHPAVSPDGRTSNTESKGVAPCDA
jgi:mannose-6-phosphate isomerase-like protein (cupin superfamily)